MKAKSLISGLCAGIVLTIGQSAMASDDDYRYRGDNERYEYSDRVDRDDYDGYREVRDDDSYDRRIDRVDMRGYDRDDVLKSRQSDQDDTRFGAF